MTLTWNPPTLPAQKVAVHENTAAHATPVHEGARLNNGGVIEPRPWMTQAYLGGLYDPVAEFAKQYRRTNSLATAFQATALGGQREMFTLLRADVWSWPNETRRRNGEVVGSPRNIIDRGELYDNQQPVRYR
jgi:hypothetical protein